MTYFASGLTVQRAATGWEKVLETAALRYERLIALGKQGLLKDKRKRML